MITNCNSPFEFSLLLLYFVFVLRYLITNCFFCSVSYPVLPLCNSVVQLRCSAVLLRCSFMLLHCSDMLLRCSFTLLRCSFMLLRCSFMPLCCSDVLLRCSFMLLRCSGVLDVRGWEQMLTPFQDGGRFVFLVILDFPWNLWKPNGK